jgi:hypothetical protein
MARSVVLLVLGGCAGVSAFLCPASNLASLPSSRLRSVSSGPLPTCMQACGSGDVAVDVRTHSRRSVLAGAAFLAAGAAVPQSVCAYDFKKEKSSSGEAEFDVPEVWIKTASDEEAGTFAFSNPVSGKVLDQIIVREYEAPAGIANTKDVGKIEKIKPSKAFGATSEVSTSCMHAPQRHGDKTFASGALVEVRWV